MEPTGKSHSASRRKTHVSRHLVSVLLFIFDRALACDGYLCIITGMFDRESLDKSVVVPAVS